MTNYNVPIPIYALTAVTRFEIKDQYKGRKGKFIKNFLLNDKRNKNGWRTTWESIKTHYEDFLNKPGTYYEKPDGTPDHPDGQSYKSMMSNQENYRVVNIAGLELDEKTHSLYSISEILDEEISEVDFEGLLKDGKINFTSPGVWPVKSDVVGTMADGSPELDVHEWKALHFSYINDPAFGEKAAKSLGTCEGLGGECMTMLAANTNLEGSDALEPLQEVPLIRKALNKHFTPCDLKAFHQELTADTAESSCVSRKLKIISKENPDMAQDQQLAIAYSYCQDEGLSELANDIKNNRDVNVIS